MLYVTFEEVDKYVLDKKLRICDLRYKVRNVYVFFETYCRKFNIPLLMKYKNI